MFVKIGEFTINTDNIKYAEAHVNQMTTVNFVGGGEIQLDENEAAALWTLLARVETIEERANQ